MARRRITAKQRAASRRNIRKAQIASARKRKGTGRAKTSNRRRNIKRAAIITGVAMGAATGAYAVDRKVNTVKLYHNTNHSRARRIAKHGYAPGQAGRRPDLGGPGMPGVPKHSHEHGRVFFAAGRNNSQFFGPATTTMRVRKKKWQKVAHLDTHPAALAGGFDNFYYVKHSDLKALGGRARYTRLNRARANVRIRRRNARMDVHGG